MPLKITAPSVFEAMGNKPIVIKEYVGNVNTKNNAISIAEINCPGNWIEPGQTPEFDEYTIMLRGSLQVKTKEKTFVINEGQAIITQKGEWVQYSTPTDAGAHYFAVCLPAFSMDLAKRDQI